MNCFQDTPDNYDENSLFPLKEFNPDNNDDNNLSDLINNERDKYFDNKNKEFDDLINIDLITPKFTDAETYTKHFLEQKRERENDDNISDENLYHNNNIINENEKEKEINIIIKEKETNTQTKRLGRLRKDDDNTEDIKHTKFGEDNMMKKIKAAVSKYTLNLLNNSLKYTRQKFCPLCTELNEDLKRNTNMDLLDKKIYNIFESYEVNKNNIMLENQNIMLMKKIFEENIETETINILNMTYKDILDRIREIDSVSFLNAIREKEKKYKGKKKFNVDDYMKKLTDLLYDYEHWFEIKNARKVVKKRKNVIKIE